MGYGARALSAPGCERVQRLFGAPPRLRAYNSRSVAACRDAFETYAEWDVPVDADHQSSYKCVQVGLLYALAGSGQPASLLELTAALRILLEDPNAAVRWCAGENVLLPPSWPLTIPSSKLSCLGPPLIPCVAQTIDSFIRIDQERKR